MSIQIIFGTRNLGNHDAAESIRGSIPVLAFEHPSRIRTTPGGGQISTTHETKLTIYPENVTMRTAFSKFIIEPSGARYQLNEVLPERVYRRQNFTQSVENLAVANGAAPRQDIIALVSSSRS